MIFKPIKTLPFLLGIFIGLSSNVIAQDFYKDYRVYLKSRQNHISAKREKLIDAEIERVKLTIAACETETKRRFFASNTVFIVSFFGAETGSFAEIIWTKNASCYYDFKWISVKEGEKPKRKLTVSANGAETLGSFDMVFRGVIESGDTVGYLIYANKHKVFDGEYVSPLRAINDGRHWNFTSFKGNGWAIDYTNFFEKMNKKSNEPASLNALINKLTKERLGFDIDSANAAYLSDTSKFKKQPSYPVILLNGKVINYWQHEPIELYRVKAIDISMQNSHNQAIPVGINSEFGIISITTTDEKPN